MKGFIFQQTKPKVSLITSTEHTPPVIIDLGDLKVSTLIGVSTSTTPPTISASTTPHATSPSREPLEIIQSTGTNTSDDSNIFSRFLKIKQKNESLMSNMYSQFWKQTSTSQHRLLSTYDSEKGRMQMAFLQAQIPFPKSPSDYKKIAFSFFTSQIHPIDQMDMHKQTGEMMFFTMTTATMSLSKLTTALSNVQSQIEL